MIRRKVTISQSFLFGYRVPIFNLLCDYVDLLVCADSYKKPVDIEQRFRFRRTPLISFLGAWWQSGLVKCCSESDRVILMFDAKLISNIFVLFLFKAKGVYVAFWGIGLGRKLVGNYVRLFLSHFADSVIVYSKQAAEQMIKFGFSKEKIHVAVNTVLVPNPTFKSRLTHRDLIFVGRLEQRKGLSDLLAQFALSEYPGSLHLIGEGPLWGEIERDINQYNVGSKVVMYGEITDYDVLKSIYDKCILAVSPKQAGLSVLQSLAHGVPFATEIDAVSGGEIENITDGETGFKVGLGARYENIFQLLCGLQDIADEELLRMSKASYDHYQEYASAKAYCVSLLRAIDVPVI